MQSEQDLSATGGEGAQSLVKTVILGVLIATLSIGVAKGISYYRSSKSVTSTSSTPSANVGDMMRSASGDAGGPPSGGTPPTGAPPVGGGPQ